MSAAVLLYTDAGSRGNPGRAALAYLIYSPDGTLLKEETAVIGNTTNNRAEYLAVLAGLQACAGFTQGKVRCVSDSELLVRQVNGDYRVRDEALKELHRHVLDAVKGLDRVTFEHHPRTDPRIARADRMLNRILDYAR